MECEYCGGCLGAFGKCSSCGRWQTLDRLGIAMVLIVPVLIAVPVIALLCGVELW